MQLAIETKHLPAYFMNIRFCALAKEIHKNFIRQGTVELVNYKCTWMIL